MVSAVKGRPPKRCRQEAFTLSFQGHRKSTFLGETNMKKLFATLLLLMCVSVVFAGKAGDSDGAVNNPDAPVCHDKSGKWNPDLDKRCDEPTCGCLFHEIGEFVIGIFS